MVTALPMAWLASEFGKRRALRIGLGLAAIGSTMGVAYLVGHFYRFNYNAWYGVATSDLINTTVGQIEDGNVDHVMTVLRRLKLDYQPTYEDRAHYDELVNKAVAEMKGERALDEGDKKLSPFTRETWLGHWENDTGFWIVISGGRDVDIVRSGDIRPKMSNVVFSEDFRKVTFVEGDRWRHALTLKNKYEATHVWRHLDDNRIFTTDTLHNLRRATPAERAFTQQRE